MFLLLIPRQGVFIKGHWSFSGFFTAYFTIIFFRKFYWLLRFSSQVRLFSNAGRSGYLLWMEDCEEDVVY